VTTKRQKNEKTAKLEVIVNSFRMPDLREAPRLLENKQGPTLIINRNETGD